MKRAMWFLLSFLASGVFWFNLIALVPVNANYVHSWWNVGLSSIFFVYFCVLASEAKP